MWYLFSFRWKNKNKNCSAYSLLRFVYLFWECDFAFKFTNRLYVCVWLWKWKKIKTVDKLTLFLFIARTMNNKNERNQNFHLIIENWWKYCFCLPLHLQIMNNQQSISYQIIILFHINVIERWMTAGTQHFLNISFIFSQFLFSFPSYSYSSIYIMNIFMHWSFKKLLYEFLSDFRRFHLNGFVQIC